MGRPTKLTRETQDAFLKAIHVGAFPEVAARHAGFSPASLYRWLRGTTPEQVEFRDAFLEATANYEIRLMGTIARAALTDPRWALVVLERRFPERWRLHARSDEPVDESTAPSPRAEPDVILDPSMVELLVPRLLAAGRELAGRPEEDELDLAAFSDDGTTRDQDEVAP